MSNTNELVLKPTYWASVSGGKDSLYMLNYILHNLDIYPLNGVVHFELEIDYPFIKDVIDYMEKECTKHNIKFVRVKPSTNWYDLYKKYAFPSRKARWCNSMYKLDALNQIKNFLKDQGQDLYCYIGYCLDEEARYKDRNKKEIYPLVNAKIEEATILEWAKTVPIFNDFYKFNKRCGCMFCPMASMMENAYLLKYYPAEYEKLIQMCKDTEDMVTEKIGKPYSIWQSNAKYNTSYRDYKIRTKYIKKVAQIEKEIKK